MDEGVLVREGHDEAGGRGRGSSVVGLGSIK